jgi:hypothetical protein
VGSPKFSSLDYMVYSYDALYLLWKGILAAEDENGSKINAIGNFPREGSIKIFLSTNPELQEYHESDRFKIDPTVVQIASRQLSVLEYAGALLLARAKQIPEAERDRSCPDAYSRDAHQFLSQFRDSKEKLTKLRSKLGAKTFSDLKRLVEEWYPEPTTIDEYMRGKLLSSYPMTTRVNDLSQWILDLPTTSKEIKD